MSNYIDSHKAFWVCGAQQDYQGLGRGKAARREFLELMDLEDVVDITTMKHCPFCNRGPTSGYGCGWYTFTPFDFYV